MRRSEARFLRPRAEIDRTIHPDGGRDHPHLLVESQGLGPRGGVELEDLSPVDAAVCTGVGEERLGDAVVALAAGARSAAGGDPVDVRRGALALVLADQHDGGRHDLAVRARLRDAGRRASE